MRSRSSHRERTFAGILHSTGLSPSRDPIAPVRVGRDGEEPPSSPAKTRQQKQTRLLPLQGLFSEVSWTPQQSARSHIRGLLSSFDPPEGHPIAALPSPSSAQPGARNCLANSFCLTAVPPFRVLPACLVLDRALQAYPRGTCCRYAHPQAPTILARPFHPTRPSSGPT